MRLNLSKVDSPLGKLLLVTDKHARIRALDFADHQAHLHRVLREHYVRYELVEVPGPYESSPLCNTTSTTTSPHWMESPPRQRAASCNTKSGPPCVAFRLVRPPATGTSPVH